ncbi:MMPL family transporter [Halobacillus yeomjeoni]|uniref:MMPL family transporter n=1 Tax=Halobacillus yeomjeoni TaxID=311194 RepID=A0A931MWV3_9BACI|nr:MMPL family transporter [Halobacillus yeomjeoni]MBH0231629.1 MMPL family transporter [Halobacillus yeomjeoni]
MKKLSSWIVRLHKWFLALWVVMAVVLGFLAVQLPSLLEGDGFRTEGEYEKVDEVLKKDFDFPESTLFLLFEEPSEDKISSILEMVEKRVSPSTLLSPLDDSSMIKNDIAYASIQFTDPAVDIQRAIHEVEKVIQSEEGVTLTGAPVISEDINKASQEDLKRAELIGLPVALIVLVFAFGTLFASLIPLIIGAVTIICGFGVLSLIGQDVQLSIFILNIAPMIGLALSIDFALLFINRYREELKKQEKEEALKTTIQTAGRSILFSAVCVFIGLAAMSIIQVDIFMNIAIGGSIVIVFAVLGSLTLLPSLLYIAGPHINKWRIISVRSDTSPKWRRFAEKVMKRPVAVSVAALIVLSIGILPVTNMNLTIPTIDSLPQNYESRTAYDTIDDTFFSDQESVAYAIAERQGGWLSLEGLEKMEEIKEELGKAEIVQEVSTLYSESNTDSPDQLSKALSQEVTRSRLEPAVNRFVSEEKLVIPIKLTATANSKEAKQLMTDWDQKEWSVPMMFGGRPKFNQEIYYEIENKIYMTLAVILVSTFIILMIAFRSIAIPLKAILMNVIGLASTFGILVWLFQGGQFGLNPSDIALILPVIVFSLVFGLSMDYEVFLISRIHEFYLNGKDNTTATIEGLATTSKIITSAALIMIVITGAFAFTDVVPVKQIGIGIALAIFLDATIIRLLLVPSLMKLMGDWNWWLPGSRQPIRKKEH